MAVDDEFRHHINGSEVDAGLFQAGENALRDVEDRTVMGRAGEVADDRIAQIGGPVIQLRESLQGTFSAFLVEFHIPPALEGQYFGRLVFRLGLRQVQGLVRQYDEDSISGFQVQVCPGAGAGDALHRARLGIEQGCAGPPFAEIHAAPPVLAGEVAKPVDIHALAVGDPVHEMDTRDRAVVTPAVPGHLAAEEEAVVPQSARRAVEGHVRADGLRRQHRRELFLIADRYALRLQRLDTGADFLRHIGFASGAEHQYPVTLSALRDQAAAVRPHGMQEHVGIGIVEIVPNRNLGQVREILASVLRRGVGVFAVVQQDVRHAAARLHHRAAAGEIVRPDLGVGGPGLVAVEPLSVAEEGQSGQVVVRRLGGAVVDDEAVEAARQRHVRHHLDVAGVVGVGPLAVPVDGEGFGGRDGFAVNMGNGRAFAYVADGGRRQRSAQAVGHPDAGHRVGGVLLDRHAVAQEGASHFVGLDVGALHPEAGDDLIDAGVILLEEFGEGLAPVAQELLAALRAADDLSGQHGQPGHQVIAPAGLEFLRKGGRPGLRSGLVTVDQQMRDAPFTQHASGRFLIQFQVTLEITLPGALVQLIHFQARGVGGGGMVHLAGQRGAEAPDAPFSLGKGAGQVSVRRHPGAEVDHVPFFRAERGRNLVRAVFPGVIGVRGARTLLHPLQFGDGEKLQGLQLGSRHAEMPGLDGRDVHRGIFQDGQQQFAGRLPRLAVAAVLEFVRVRHVSGAGPETGRSAAEGKGADRDRAGERDRDHAVGSGDLGPQLFHRPVLVAQAHGNHGDIIAEGIHLHVFLGPGNVPVGARDFLQRRQLHIHPAAFDVQRLPFELLHRVLRTHPGTAGAAPAGRAGHGHLHPQRVRQGNGKAEGFFPVVGEVRALEGCRLGHVDAAGVELVEAGYAHGIHPFEVFAYAVKRHFTVHPVPPDIGSG